MFAIIPMIYILPVIVLFIPNEQLYVQSRRWGRWSAVWGVFGVDSEDIRTTAVEVVLVSL